MATYVFGSYTANNKDHVKKHRRTFVGLKRVYRPGDSGFDFLAALYEGIPELFPLSAEEPKQILQIEFAEHYSYGSTELGCILTTADGMLPYVSYEFGLMPIAVKHNPVKRLDHYQKVAQKKLIKYMRRMVTQSGVRGVCAECGGLAIDYHHEGIPFKDISRRWILDSKYNPLQLYHLVQKRSLDGGDICFPPSLQMDWVEFHDSNAKLVPLCELHHSHETYGGRSNPRHGVKFGFMDKARKGDE